MGVNNHTRNVESSPQDYVGGFSSHAGQAGERGQFGRHPTAVLLDQGLGATLDVACFVAEKAGRMDAILDPCQGGGGQPGGRPEFLKQAAADPVDLAICALGRKNGGDQELKGAVMVELRLDIRICTS